jgi:hypothetical protein
MSQELRDAMAEMAAAHGASGPHPDPEELAAYHAGELSLAEEERLRDHLVACRECAGLLLDLDGLADPGFGAGAGSEDKDAVWQRLQEETRAPASIVSAPVVPLRRPAPASPRWLPALAAALLVATLGLSLWVATLRRTVEDLSRPQLNAPVLDLYSGTARGEGSPPPVFAVPRETRFFTVILNPAGQRRYDGYRVEILRADGRKVWAGGGLERNAFGSFSLTLPRGALGPGEHRIRLLGRTGRDGKALEEPIEEYALRVE